MKSQEKQLKTKNQQIKWIKGLFSKELLNEKSNKEIKKIKIAEQPTIRDNFIYKTENKKQ